MFCPKIANSQFVQGSPLVYVGDKILTAQGDFKFEKVTPTFYRGSDAPATKFHFLAKKGIKKIINLKTISKEELQDLQKAAKKMGIEYVNIPLDPYNIKKYVPSLIKELKDPKRKFVHCTFGIDRTGFVTGLKRLLDGVPHKKVFAEMEAHGFKGIRQLVFFPMVETIKNFKLKDFVKPLINSAKKKFL